MRAASWLGAGIPLLAACLAAGCTPGTGPGAGPQAARHRTAPTSRWRVISYHGVHVTVPRTWPVVDGMHVLPCGGPFPAAPTAFTGPDDNPAPSCPIVLAPRARDGVWLQPGSPPPGARPVVIRPGTVVLEQRGDRQDHVLRLWSHGIFVEIGIGPHRRVSDAILASVRYAPGQPDTRAAGRCPRSAGASVMPRPRRLAARLVLDQGDVTLTRPLPGDRPAMRAMAAWRASAPISPFRRYQVILARYSAKFPAIQNADGSLTLLDHDVLAWVIYARPRRAIPGCGGWGLVAFDARTSQQIVSSGWSPGP